MEFEYIAISKEGERIQSMMQAESAAAVATSLRNSGGKPLKITALKKDKAPDLVEQIFSNRKRVTSKELVVFTRQLGTVISAGVLLTEALETISMDMDNKYFAAVLQNIIFKINSGESF